MQATCASEIWLLHSLIRSFLLSSYTYVHTVHIFFVEPKVVPCGCVMILLRILCNFYVSKAHINNTPQLYKGVCVLIKFQILFFLLIDRTKLIPTFFPLLSSKN